MPHKLINLLELDYFMTLA